MIIRRLFFLAIVLCICFCSKDLCYFAEVIDEKKGGEKNEETKKENDQG